VSFKGILALFLVGTLRCGVQRRVQRRNKWNWTSFHASSARSARAGTSQRDVPTTSDIKNRVWMRPSFQTWHRFIIDPFWRAE